MRRYKKSKDKLKESIRQKTRRTDGRSMRAICEDLSRTLRGWFGYFKHGKANVLEDIDAYVRGRLRSILRKRVALHGFSGNGGQIESGEGEKASDRKLRISESRKAGQGVTKRGL